MLQARDHVIDPETGLIRGSDGKSIELRHQSKQVLLMLARSAGDVVSKQHLFATVWPDSHVTDDSLVQCISDIRKALGDDQHRLVETVPRKGYRLNAEPAVIAASAERQRRPVYLTLVALGVLTMFGTMYLTGTSDNPEPSSAADDEVRSILVLPILATPDDPKSRLFAAGLTNDIAADLGRHRDISVVAPLFADQAAAKKLAAESGYVLMGTLNFSQDRIGVTVSLQSSDANEIVWSERWSEPSEAYFDVREDILDRVSTSLASAWTGAIAEHDRTSAWTRKTTDLSAYESYLIGLYHKHGFTTAGFEASRSHLERAVEIDPDFARGWSALYFLNSLQGMETEDPALRAEMRKATRDIAKRLQVVAPDDPYSLLVQSILPADVHDHEGVNALVRRAVSKAPSNADILALAAISASKHGSLSEEAMEWARRANQLNPTAPPYFGHALGYAALATEDFDMAYRAFAETPGPVANSILAAYAADRLGATEDADRFLSEFESRMPKTSSLAEILDLQSTSRSLGDKLLRFYDKGAR